jgi:hypothetical protein
MSRTSVRFNFPNFFRSSTAALASDLALTPYAQEEPCVAVLPDREIRSVWKTGKEHDGPREAGRVGSNEC